MSKDKRATFHFHPRGVWDKQFDCVFNTSYVEVVDAGGGTPPVDCGKGSWNFSMACQSAHMMTAGMI